MSLNNLHHKPIIPRKDAIETNFRKWMFWDVDMEKLSIKDDKFFIIDRVLSGCMENPIYLDQLDKIFSRRDIINVAKSSRSIRGNESIRFIASRYRMNPKSFKQYIHSLQTKKQEGS